MRRAALGNVGGQGAVQHNGEREERRAICLESCWQQPNNPAQDASGWGLNLGGGTASNWWRLDTPLLKSDRRIK